MLLCISRQNLIQLNGREKQFSTLVWICLQIYAPRVYKCDRGNQTYTVIYIQESYNSRTIQRTEGLSDGIRRNEHFLAQLSKWKPFGYILAMVLTDQMLKYHPGRRGSTKCCDSCSDYGVRKKEQNKEGWCYNYCEWLKMTADTQYSFILTFLFFKTKILLFF